MKNGNYISSRSYNSSKSQKYVLTSPNKEANYNLLINNNNYLSKTKRIFKYERKKEKDHIFKLFKEVPKRQAKREQVTLKNNHKHLLHSLAILNNANIDEGIILNKYFAYLKNSSVERKQLMELKYKNMLTPIKQKEKEIQKMKKRINFHKSISNLMLMKIMIENKEKLDEFIKELKQNENNPEYSYGWDRPKNALYFSDKRKHKSKLYLKDHSSNLFLTGSNNSNNRKRIFMRGQFDKKYVPNLKLKSGETNINDDFDEIFITSYSRNKNQNNFQNQDYTTAHTPKNSIIINNKYYTPQTNKRDSQLYNLINEKNTGKTCHSSRKSFRNKNIDFNNIFSKFKKSELNIQI